MDNTYKCTACGGVFDKGWTDEEAMQEKENNFGDIPMQDCDVVCDDCFKALYETHKEEA